VIETTTETGNDKISAKTSIFTFPVVGRYRSFQGSLELAVVKKQICRWNFDSICYSSGDKTISGFVGYNAISGYQSLLQSPEHTFLSSP